MLPGFAMYHLPHVAGRNSKLFCNSCRFYSRCAQLAYARDVGLGKAPMHFTFFHRIKSVINLSPKKKMIWPHAELIVTLMEDMHRMWNFPMMNHPGKPVRRNCTRLPCMPAHDIHPPVSGGQPHLTSPKPAIAKSRNVHGDWSVFIHSVPESLPNRNLDAARGDTIKINHVK